MIFKCILFISLLVSIEPSISIDSNALLNEKLNLVKYLLTEFGSDRNQNVCCKIDPPMIPIFSSDGHLLNYQQAPCPEQYKVCCKGYINISGYCILLETATALLPQWQALAQSLGISLGQAIIQSGTLVG